ncbi:MAG: hypothetical protein GY795_41490 [Desulfobacterales bacterium]|nr:hypothetical protein [Desulfobacterales bacterium]
MEGECWKSKTSPEISQDKENINQGDCPIILLSTEHTEENDIHRLLEMLTRRKISSYDCYRGNYDINGKVSSKLPKSGVIFYMTGFPINIYMETEFENRLFLLDKNTKTAQSWKYKWIGEIQNNDKSDYDCYTLRIYPEKTPATLMVTNLTAFPKLISPIIQQPINVQTASSPKTIEVKLKLTLSRPLQKKRTDELRDELKIYEDFVGRWERIDNPSLKKQEERYNELMNTLVEGERLWALANDHISYLKSEIAMLSGKTSDGDQLICIPADPKKNYEFYDQIVKQPWELLRSIYFLPVSIQKIQCYLLRIGREEKDNPLFKYFMSIFKSKQQKSSNIIYEFRPDTRWFQFNIQVWVPEGYALEPYFFNYKEKEEAVSHLKEMVKSLWGEKSEEYKEFAIQLESDSLNHLELAFIPPFGESKLKPEAPPGVIMLNKNDFNCLSDNLKLINYTQPPDKQTYFENHYQEILKNVFDRFYENNFLQNCLKKANPEEKKKFISTKVEEYLNEDIQKYLFEKFDENVLEKARDIIQEKTKKTDEIVKNIITDLLDEKRRYLIRRVNMEFKDLHDYYQQWSDSFQKTRDEFIKTQTKAESALKEFKRRWNEAKAKWTSLFNKTDQLRKIENFFEKTEKSFKRLIKSLTIKLLYTIILLIFFIMLFVMLWNMEPPV